MYIGQKINDHTTIVGISTDAIYIGYENGIVKWYPETDTYEIETMGKTDIQALKAILDVRKYRLQNKEK